MPATPSSFMPDHFEDECLRRYEEHRYLLRIVLIDASFQTFDQTAFVTSNRSAQALPPSSFY